MTVLAWICACLGAPLAYIVLLAGGMRTAPRIQLGEAILASVLPGLALLSSTLSVRSNLDDTGAIRLFVSSGLPALLAMATIAIVGFGYLGQPSPTGVARWFRQLLRGPVRIHWSRELRSAPYRMRIANYPNRGWTTRTLSRQVDRLYLPSADETVLSAYLIEIAHDRDFPGEGRAWPRGHRVLVGTSTANSLVSEASLTLDGDRCFVVIGAEVSCLEVPSMDLSWRATVDCDHAIVGVRLTEDRHLLELRDRGGHVHRIRTDDGRRNNP